MPKDYVTNSDVGFLAEVRRWEADLGSSASEVAAYAARLVDESAGRTRYQPADVVKNRRALAYGEPVAEDPQLQKRIAAQLEALLAAAYPTD